MRFWKSLLALPVVVGLGACGNDDFPPPDKLDVSWMDTMTFVTKPVASPIETGLLAEGEEAEEARVQPVRRPASTARRATTSRTSSGTYRAPTPAPAPRTETVRHTARDAAIGAGAGAVIGAVAGGSRHRVRGAIIGAAAGAVVGGVIGHTVDKEERVIRP